MKILLTFFLLLIYQLADCQSVTINPVSLNANLIEINSSNKSILIPRLTSTQRTSIANPPSGLLVYDTTTNSQWYFNGTNWVEIITATNNNPQWQINADNQYSANSGNVGIGTEPQNAKFEVAAYYRSQAIFGSDYAGLSWMANKPAIGYNIYNDNTSTNRYLTQGFGLLEEFDTATGILSWQPLSYRNKDEDALPSQNPSYYLRNNGQFGSKVHVTNGPETKFFNNDFSIFGENSPKIKYRVYTGTTTSAGVFTNVGIYNHYTAIGLQIASSRVLKVYVIIECGGTRPFVPANQCGDSYYNSHCFRYYLDNSGILTLVHEGESSLETYSKPYKVMIIYTE